MRRKSSFSQRRKSVKKEDYYTDPKLIDVIIKKYITPIVEKGLITHFVDNSAGNGYLLGKLLKKFPDLNLQGFDKFDASQDFFPVKKKDFLTLKKEESGKQHSTEKYLVGFNPPYGINGMLARKFIEKSVELYDPECVIMILPFVCTEKKYKGLILYKHEILPEDSFFRPNGTKFSYPTFLCVFKKANINDIKSIQTIEYFPINVKDMYQYKVENVPEKTILIRRIGANSGRCGYVKLHGKYKEFKNGKFTNCNYENVDIIPKTFITILMEKRTSVELIGSYIQKLAKFKETCSYKRTFSIKDICNALD